MAKKMMGLILLLMLVVPVLGQKAPKENVTFFAPGSFYVYLQGSMAWVNPDHAIYSSKEGAFAPVFGVGFRAVDLNWMYLNLEFDFSQVRYGSGYADRRVRFYNFKLGTEFAFPWIRNLGFLAAFGVGSITYPDQSYDSYDGKSEITFLAELGVKVKLSRHLSIRSDLRFFTEPESIDDDYYYEDSSHLIASALSVGLQYNF